MCLCKCRNLLLLMKITKYQPHFQKPLGGGGEINSILFRPLFFPCTTHILCFISLTFIVIIAFVLLQMQFSTCCCCCCWCSCFLFMWVRERVLVPRACVWKSATLLLRWCRVISKQTEHDILSAELAGRKYPFEIKY